MQIFRDPKVFHSETMEDAIAKVEDMQLAEIGMMFNLMYSRTEEYALTCKTKTLIVTWGKNTVVKHSTIRDQIVDVIENVVFTFSKQVPDSTLEVRKKECSTCPLFDSSSNKCRSCGCYMTVKWAYEKSTCPLKKW